MSFLELDIHETIDSCPICDAPLSEVFLIRGEVPLVECPSCVSKKFDLFDGECTKCEHTLWDPDHGILAKKHGYILVKEATKTIPTIDFEEGYYLCCGKPEGEDEFCPDCNEQPYVSSLSIDGSMPSFFTVMNNFDAEIAHMASCGYVYAEPTDLVGDAEAIPGPMPENIEVLNCADCAYKYSASCLSFVNWLKRFIVDHEGNDRIERCNSFISTDEYNELVGYNHIPHPLTRQHEDDFEDDYEDDEPFNIAQFLEPDAEIERHFRYWMDPEEEL